MIRQPRQGHQNAEPISRICRPISLILSGKCGISIQIARKLADFFGLPAQAFMEL
jgi:antitoxin component HigA of HigAB toxin-antitoxin module